MIEAAPYWFSSCLSPSLFVSLNVLKVYENVKMHSILQLNRGDLSYFIQNIYLFEATQSVNQNTERNIGFSSLSFLICTS